MKTISLEEFNKILAKSKAEKTSLSVTVNDGNINIDMTNGATREFNIVPCTIPQNMVVTKISIEESDGDYVEFDNGLVLSSYHNMDCCENNYLDFSQFKVGMKFPAINSINDIKKYIKLHEDGIVMTTIEGLPIWSQARSEQNGYYSNSVGIFISLKNNFTIQTTSENEPLSGKEK